MTESDGAVTALLNDRLLQVIGYLDDIVSRSEAPVRVLPHERTVRAGALPDGLPGCELYAGEPWLRLVRVPDSANVVVPALLDDLIHPVRHDPAHQPGLIPDWQAEAERRGRSVGEVGTAHENWIARVWQPWASGTLDARRVTAAFNAVRGLALELQRQEGDLELVWGHGVTHGRVGTDLIDYPLLTTTVEVTVDPETGVLEVLPTGPTRLEVNAFTGMQSQYLDDLQAITGRGNVVGFDPLDDEARAAFFARALVSLGHQPRIWNPDDGPAGGPLDPLWQDGLWIEDTVLLTLRQRFSNVRGFLADLRVHASSGEALDFDGLGAISALLHDEPSTIVDDSDPAQAWQGSAERLLMPLETNEDQEKIARELSAKKLVAVQGPPGTGKTHTIANLISHLVAHGKRVLVVAHKEEPLTEVRDKIPSSLRDLSVALIGNSASQINQMQAAVRRLTAIGSPTEAPAAARRVDQVAAELDQAIIRRGRLEAALRRVAVRDRQTLEVGAVSMRPLQVGEWLAEHQEEDGWLTDPIPHDVACPLTEAQVDQLLRIAQSSSSADRRDALRALPALPTLPTGEQLASTDQRAAELSGLEQSLLEQGLLPRAGALSVQTLQELHERVADLQRSVQGRAGWLAHLAASAANPQTAQSYRLQLTAIQGDLDALAGCELAVAGHIVTIDPEQAATPREHLVTLAKLRKVLVTNGKPSLFAGDQRQAQKQNLVDGETLRTEEDVDRVVAQIQIRQLRGSLALRWNQLAAQHHGPPTEGEYPEHEVTANVAALQLCVDEETRIWPALQAELAAVVLDVPGSPMIEWLHECTSTLGQARQLPELRQIEASLNELQDRLEAGAAQPGASNLWSQLLAAQQTRDWSRWSALLIETGRLTELIQAAARCQELTEVLASTAPRTASSIAAGLRPPNGADSLRRAWHWRSTRAWLDGVIGKDDTATIGEASHQARDEIRRLTEELAEASARHALIVGMTDGQRRALSDWATAIGKIGKGSNTKSAARWTAVAQQKMQDAVEGVPVWIMGWQRALTQFRAGSTPFDVVIVDEASQCDIRSLLVLTLAHRAVVVGDDKQISPTSFVSVDFVRDLIDRHLKSVPSASFYEPSESLFNRAVSASNGALTLSEHFRCVPEIITFSSQRWYDGRIQPLRAGAGDFAEPFKVVHTPDGTRQSLTGYGNDVNQAEADALVDTVVALNDDPAYRDKTFGVISLLTSSKQEVYLQHQILERLGERAYSRRLLKVGGAYAFQGAERDVMFVSMVADSNKKFGAFTSLDDQRRVNVTASRARDQVWIFHSAALSEFSPDDIRRSWIEYASSGFTADQHYDNLEELCESPFERAVLQQILEQGYSPVPQFRIGKYRIDFVIQLRDGSRIAIECDGDQYHQDLEADAARRAVLTRVGRCEFFSIRGSVYGSDPVGSLKPLWALLEQRGAPRYQEARPSREASPLTLGGPADDPAPGAGSEPPAISSPSITAEQQAAVELALRMGATIRVASDGSIEITPHS